MPQRRTPFERIALLLQGGGARCCRPCRRLRRAKAWHRRSRAIAKDFKFSRRTMEEHWQTGYSNARQTLANPEVLELPDRLEGVRTFDIGPFLVHTLGTNARVPAFDLLRRTKSFPRVSTA